jgi:glycine/D-amino acid oxidase-like deaminating enzyme
MGFPMLHQTGPLSMPPLPANLSPWLGQMCRESLGGQLDHDLVTDVVVVGGGIAGVATTFFLLRDTRARVTLVEANRVARGATGYNAGQLVTYFERPICRLAEDFGYEKAIAGQREVDNAWCLLDVMLTESGYPHPVQRVSGQMGMFTLNHLMVHLRNNLLRRRGDLVREYIRISSDADFLREIPPEFDGLYDVVPQDHVLALLGTEDPRYRATLSGVKGCMNSASLCEHLVQYFERAFRARFELYEQSRVDRVELHDGGATLQAMGHTVRASRVVLCTNGFLELDVVNAAGPEIPLPDRVRGTMGFMAAYYEDPGKPSCANSYLMSPRINEGQAYFYLTRRPYQMDGALRTLTCIGGPDRPLDPGCPYDRNAPYPASELNKLTAHIAPVMGWPTDVMRRWDYTWHGLMGYTDNRVRVIGSEPRNPVLLYNLGCNGVGLLPAIVGARRISRITGGVMLEPSMFDPP